MASSFIGKRISLISHSDVRYLGILAGIDPTASTIQLSNVYSMGTESRRPAAQYIPPVPDPYEYIIFRASEVKDLAVDEPAAQPSVHDDPAVVGASAQMQPTYAQQARQTPQQQQQIPAAAQQQQQQRAGQPQPSNTNPRHTANQARRTNSINSATASLETVERALGDLRVTGNGNGTPQPTANGGGGGGGRSKPRRNGAISSNSGPKPEVPTTDFDFESSNARFDKAALSKSGVDSEDGENNNNSPEGAAAADNKDDAKSPAYNPKSSFFDSLTPGPAPPPRGNRGGRGRGGRGPSLARSRREEERQRNVATFGEPGGEIGRAHV